ALRELDMSEAALGLVFSVGAIGGLLGALSASAAARLVGEGRIVALSIIVTIPGFVLTPLVVELPGRAELWLAIASALVSWGGVVYNVTQVSFRQRVCPPQLLGRMNATIRFLVWGTLPLGSMLGGVLGGAFGIVTALWV